MFDQNMLFHMLRSLSGLERFDFELLIFLMCFSTANFLVFSQVSSTAKKEPRKCCTKHFETSLKHKEAKSLEC